jgi:hypothetical protein
LIQIKTFKPCSGCDAAKSAGKVTLRVDFVEKGLVIFGEQ